MNSTPLRFIAIVLTCLTTTPWLAPSPATAQEGPVLATGSRVRATLRPPWPDRSPLHGRIAELRGDTLVVSLDSHDTTAILPLGSIDRLQVSQGMESRSRSTVRGVARGLLTAAIMLPLVALVDDEPGISTDDAALLFGAGAVLGGSRGYLRPRERWRDVGLRPDVDAAHSPSTVGPVPAPQ